MLTDIFADRYAARPLWSVIGEPETKLLVQCFRLVAEQVMPYWRDGKEIPSAKPAWEAVHNRLSMELGLAELSPRLYSYKTTFGGQQQTNSGFLTYDLVCKAFVCATPPSDMSPDRFMKERISFIELAFRSREEELVEINKQLPQAIQQAALDDLVVRKGIRVPGTRVDFVRSHNDALNRQFFANVDELNERLRRANCKLNYHNGFIQVDADEQVEVQIERPFWKLVAAPKWKNVDIDMKEAIDRRDTNGRDPAFYAARALESTIKIISNESGWTHGGEKGAHNFIDNLGAKKNAFIAQWEADALKAFFSAVRNPFGHGPGAAEMPKLSDAQTNCAIENCMSWIKGLIQRLPKQD